MAHSGHNKPKKSGACLVMILGALLFIICPTIHPSSPELGTLAFVFGFIVGGIGFYLRFVRKGV